MAQHNLPEWMQSQQADFPQNTRVIYIDTIGYIMAWGVTVPSDGATGYAKSCFFHHTDASGSTDAIYINIGDTDSANFDSYRGSDINDYCCRE